MIVHDPHPALRRKTKEVTEFDTGSLRKLVRRMHVEMVRESGVGLAAPQVGVNKSLFVAYLGLNKDLVVCVNPELDLGLETIVGKEGCLSLPGVWRNVRRATTCTLKAWNIEGKSFEMKLSGLAARIVQHEMDHLSGILITDIAETD